jgi:hypothetical protein
LSVEDVVNAELSAILARRARLAAEAVVEEKAESASSTPSDPEGIYVRCLKHELCGIAISGGGIRSATFALGILQSMAANKLLKTFDYLSTVSGGGYIGSWFSAWVSRANLEQVTRDLTPRRLVGAVGELPANNLAPEEAHPIKHLRYYSNYLAPKVGLFSIDGWALITIYLRNLFLNQTVLLLGVLGLLWIMRALVDLFTLAHTAYLGGIIGGVGAIVVVPCFLFGAYESLRCLRGIAPTGDSNVGLPVDEVLPKIVLPWLAAAVSVCLFAVVPKGFGWLDELAEAWNLVVAGVLAGVLQAVLGGISSRNWVRSISSGFLAGFIGGLSMYVAMFGMMIISTAVVAPVTVFGPPIVLAGFVLANFFFVGLMGDCIEDQAREWWAAISARLLLTALFWLLAFFIAIYGPYLVAQALASTGWPAWISGILGTGWIASLITGILAGNSSKTDGQSRNYLESAARFAPALFLAAFVLIVAAMSCWATYEVYARWLDHPDWTYWEQRDRLLLNLDFPKSALPLLWRAYPPILVLLAGGLLSIGFSQWLGNRIGVNTFSLQEMYAWRLIRCYLGASNGARKPDPLTNFDGKDDIKLSELAIAGGNPVAGPGSYAGPHLIVNCALNRSPEPVKPRDESDSYGLQFRQAESFIMTPLHCGSAATGYCAATEFAGGISLGKAVGISGAAVSPNMGYHTAAAVRILLSFFNLRLGAWFGNPRLGTERVENPPASWKFIMRELFGETRVDDYVYLSDGGHFENMGVYELIRRRCRYILAIDAGADPLFLQENLGDMVRKARIDFGIRIDIDSDLVRTNASGLSRSHFAVGTIRYSELHPGQPDGILIYIKSTLTGDEPPDLQNYKAEHPSFPNDSTLDQFYTEMQFESYRVLGLHTMDKLLEGTISSGDGAPRRGLSPVNARELFTAVEERWAIRPPQLHVEYVKDNDAYCEILRRLRTEPLLGRFAAEICEFPPPADEQVDPQARATAERLMIKEMLTLLENVWINLDLEDYGENRLNSGWVSVFRSWAQSPTVKQAWEVVKSEYNPAFAKYITGLQKVSAVNRPEGRGAESSNSRRKRPRRPPSSP